MYFPNGGVCSITTVLSTGTMVEAATVGDEGMVGIEAFLSADAVAPGEAFMQVPDTNAEMLSVEAFRREVRKRGALHDLMGRYTQVVGRTVRSRRSIGTATCSDGPASDRVMALVSSANRAIWRWMPGAISTCRIRRSVASKS